MREAYRVNKQILSELLQWNDCSLDLLFIYRGKTTQKPRYLKIDDVKPDMIRCLELVSARIDERKNV